MTMLIRQLFAIAVLPFTVAVLVPIWIAGAYAVHPALGHTAGTLAVQAVGIVLAAIGLVLSGWSLRHFGTDGRGTPAPWDPPRQLVVQGPYRFVRNPMISGVALVLFAEAAFLHSGPHAVWALGFVALNAVYIPLVEEPQLVRRFGDSYREYCRHVPRLVPRLRPWSATGGAAGAA